MSEGCTAEGAKEAVYQTVSDVTNYPKARINDDMLLRDYPLEMDDVQENALVGDLADYVKRCTDGREGVGHVAVAKCENVDDLVKLIQGKVA
jgi:hypothetical protein